MRRSRFTDKQIIGVMKAHEAGMQAADLGRKHGISGATPCKWKARHGGMAPSDVAKLRSLEDEDRRLTRRAAKPNKLLAEQMLDNAVLKDLLERTDDACGSSLAAVERVIVDHGCSKWRARRLIGVDRSSFQYERAGGGGASVRVRLRELADGRRFGCRRLAILLRRDARADEPEEGPLAPQGAADGAKARRLQARAGHTGADGDPARAEPALDRRLTCA